MSEFKVGDTVSFRSGVCTSIEDFNKELMLLWDSRLPPGFMFKKQYVILQMDNVSGYISIDAYPGGWWVLPKALENLTKEEKWVISKNRVETRHLRKKCGQ